MTVTTAADPDIDYLIDDEEAKACECIHCPEHREKSGAHCDHPAEYGVRIHALTRPANHHVLLCAACLKVALDWASQAVKALDVCPECHKPLRCAEDLVGPVIAL